jgi:hypothetical protein
VIATHLARLQCYYHIDATLGTNSTRRTNQTPRANLDRRRYGSAMQVPATTHETVDQGGSIYGPEKKVEGFAKVQTRATTSDLMAVIGGTAGAGRVFGISRTLWRQNGRLNPDPWLCSLGCCHKRVCSPVKWQAALCLSVERSRSYVFCPA